MTLHRRFIFIALVLLLCFAAAAGQNSAGTQTVLVLPFDNSTHQPGLEWISEAFPEILGQRLDTQSVFVISRDDRQYAFDRMGIPVNLHASRATLYRIASQLDADFIVLGSYSFDGQTFSTRAQVLDMKALRLSPDMVESGPLNDLIGVQSALAWDVLRHVRPSFSEPRQTFIQRTPAIRLNAFENFIRGVIAGGTSDKIRYLKAAIAINPQYAQAIFLLGKTYFSAREYEQAAQWLTKVPVDDASSGEAHFLLGLAQFNLGQFEKASASFKVTAERVPLTEVLNNIGVAENRRGHHDAADYFQKAVQADPSDADYHFNLAVALYRKGDISGAQRQLRESLSRRPNDTEARQFQEALSNIQSSAIRTPVASVPLTRIKRNYDESSYRQLALELQNAIEQSVGKAKPTQRAAMHLERAREFLNDGAVSEAENQFREAINLEPRNAVALSGLAHALLLQNKVAQARREANGALRVQPTAEAYLVLARADLSDKDSVSAEENLQKALALEPANQDAAAVRQEIQKRRADLSSAH